MSKITNVLLITYDDAAAARLSIPRLLETLDERSTVWLWHNGSDTETLEVARRFSREPGVERFHNSPENLGLRTPINWLWTESEASYLSKVDDDCLVSPGWLQTLRSAHEDWANFGAIGSWRHYPDEFIPEAAQEKIQSYPGGHRILRNHWVQGSGHLLKRSDVLTFGPLADGMSFTDWCLKIARAGRHNGFYYPFIFEDHMDDPRSANSLIRSDADLQRRMPLTAARNSVSTLAEWDERNRNAARLLQEASLDIRKYYGWRRKRGHMTRRIKNYLSHKNVTW